MMRRFFHRQVVHRSSKMTWVSVDWYRLKQGNFVLPFTLTEAPNTRLLRKEIAEYIVLRDDIRVDPGQVQISHKSRTLEMGDITPVVPEESPLNVTIIPTGEEKVVLERGQRFIDALWKSTPEVVTPNEEFLKSYEDPKIKILKNIPKLDEVGNRKGHRLDVVIRRDMEAFWDGVLGECDSKAPVCVVGSPGIGKSSTFILPLKKVLEEGHSVTYLSRTELKDGFYVQFIPQEGSVPLVRIYPESTRPKNLPTMSDPNAYLFVDPAETKDSCNWSRSIRARLIINASPDERHWGGAEFIKAREMGGYSLGGSLWYFRGYTLEEMLVASPHINDGIEPNDIPKLFFEFGGSVRNVFGTEKTLRNARKKREKELEKLSSEQSVGILHGITSINHMGPDAPSSTILDLVPSADWASYTSPAQSRVVRVKLLARVDSQLYYNVLSSESFGSRPRETELFLAGLLHRSSPMKFRSRACVGLNDAVYNDFLDEELGGCVAVEFVDDIVASINSFPEKTLMLSFRQNYPLFDMMYRVGDACFGFNATISMQNKRVNGALIDDVAKNLREKGCREFRLYYTPLTGFQKFTTSPVKPEVRSEYVKLLHLDIQAGVARAKAIGTQEEEGK